MNADDVAREMLFKLRLVDLGRRALVPDPPGEPAGPPPPWPAPAVRKSKNHLRKADRSQPPRARSRQAPAAATPSPCSTAPIRVSCDPVAATAALAPSARLRQTATPQLVILPAARGQVVDILFRGDRQLADAGLQRESVQLDRQPNAARRRQS